MCDSDYNCITSMYCSYDVAVGYILVIVHVYDSHIIDQVIDVDDLPSLTCLVSPGIPIH